MPGRRQAVVGVVVVVAYVVLCGLDIGFGLGLDFARNILCGDVWSSTMRVCATPRNTTYHHAPHTSWNSVSAFPPKMEGLRVLVTY